MLKKCKISKRTLNNIWRKINNYKRKDSNWRLNSTNGKKKDV